MAFDIYLLDKLDYDDAEPLIEDYIGDLIQEFVKSKVGKAHLKKYPEGGFWIGTFIDMAYIYGGYTVPKMTKGNAQEVMEYFLPRKLTLLDPSDTDNAIAELTAFWNFIGEVYQFRSAKAIAKYLQSIEDKFSQWMFDPNRGGMAKQFLMQGTEAGFDMSTQEGIEAFRAEYNRNLPTAPGPLMMGAPEMPMTPAPADMIRAFELVGVELPNEGEAVNIAELMQQFLSAVENIAPDKAEELMSLLEANVNLGGAPDPLRLPDPLGIRNDLLRMNFGQEDQLDAEKENLLRAQNITATTPGTILQDFQTALEFIQENKVTVSGKLKHISLKFLKDLNQRLTHPIEIDLKRPQQKSYPNIHGLYLLLRATGLVLVVGKGKQYRLEINSEVYDAWQTLNPTEQYFSLLESWFIRGHPEILGEERSGPLMMGDRCLNTWPKIAEKKAWTFASYSEQDNFFYYWPGSHNVALMDLFGIVKLTTTKPQSGKGWRIKKLEALPFGKALMALLHDAYLEANLQWSGMSNPEQPLGELQPFVQPYFPEWQNSLMVHVIPFRSDRHIFKVALGKMWRRLAISGEATLADLSHLILNSVDFYHDHLDQFTYETPSGRKIEVVHPAYFEGAVLRDVQLATDQVKIGSLPLLEGSTLEYVFDFGDWWEFQVQLEKIEPNSAAETCQGFAKVKTKKKLKTSSTALGEIIEVHGEAPQQYPDSDDEDW